MRKLEQMVRQQLMEILNENSIGGMSVHPFANHMAHQRDTAPQEDMYGELVKAVMMEMVAAYNEKDIKEIIRDLTQRVSVGPTGIGGKFTDEQIEEILQRVYEEIEEKIGVNISSYLPQDREHPQYMDTE